MAAPRTNVTPIRPGITRWPSYRKAAPGTGLPSPRGTVARIDQANEAMTERILSWIKEGPLDSRETAICIGCSQKNVNYHLGKLRDRGQAVFDPSLRRWVRSDNGIVRDRAAHELDKLIYELRPYLRQQLIGVIENIRDMLLHERRY